MCYFLKLVISFFLVERLMQGRSSIKPHFFQNNQTFCIERTKPYIAAQYTGDTNT